MFRRSVGWGCCERDAAVYVELAVGASAENGRKIVVGDVHDRAAVQSVFLNTTRAVAIALFRYRPESVK